MIHKFAVSPLTIVRESAVDGVEIRFALGLEHEETETDSQHFINMDTGNEIRSIPIESVVTWDHSEATWIGIEGSFFTAREVYPADAAAFGLYGYDLPVNVVKGLIMDQVRTTSIGLQAVVDLEDRRVLTLLLSSDAGLYARYDTLWHPVTDPEIFVNSYLVDTSEDAIQLYDAADSVGSQIGAAALPDLQEGIQVPPDATAEPLVQPLDVEIEVSESTVTPVINTREELETAIAAAAVDPSMRWYVERRALTLNEEVDFPW